jgi:hypothetical protein
MTETARYSKVMAEDIAVGWGTRQVRLANQGVYTLNEVNLTSFLLRALTTLRASSFNGTGLMTWTGGLPANARIFGVTSKITTAFGVTNGLASLQIGDPTTPTLWGTGLPLTLNSETDQGDFTTSDLPIYPTATDLWVSAVGGTFDATGVMELCVHYSLLRHPA